MYIAQAAARLRSDVAPDVPFDQLADIDIYTIYPVIEGATPKERLLFYCHSGEWPLVAATATGKPYGKILATINILDNHRYRCRRQIEAFHQQYFNPPQPKLLDDQRKGRIPLVNLLRYYAFWRYLASTSEDRYFTVPRVEEDFRTSVVAALRRYRHLVIALEKCLFHAERLHDNTTFFESLKWLQTIVDVPPAVIPRECRHKLLSSLEHCSRIEMRIENRIAAEMPNLTTRLRESCHEFLAKASEMPLTVPYQCNDLTKIETQHGAVVTAYCAALAHRDALFSLRSPAPEAPWVVSTNGDFNTVFNHPGLRGALALLAVATPISPDLALYDHLFIHDQSRSDKESMCSDLHQLLSRLPYAGQPIHQSVLIHLFLPFYVAGLQSDGMREARKLFSKAAKQLSGCIESLSRFGPDEMLSLVNHLESAWDDWDAPLGFAYHLLMTLGIDLLSSREDAVTFLRAKCGTGRERMESLLTRSVLHKFLSEWAQDLGSWASSTFAQDHYEQFGLIVTERTIAPALPTSANESYYRSDEGIVAAHAPDFCATEYAVSKTITTAWDKDHNADYSALRNDPVIWAAAERIIRREASSIMDEVKLDRSVDLLERINRVGLDRDIKGVLIARWVQIGLEAREVERDRRMDLLGWTTVKKTEWRSSDKRWNAYYHYFSDCGFLMNKSGLILPKSLLWSEEREWYLSNRPPK